MSETKSYQAGWQYTGDMQGPPKPLYRREDAAAPISLRQRLKESAETGDMSLKTESDILAALDELERLREENERMGNNGQWIQDKYEKAKAELATAKARLAELVEAVRGYCGIDGRDGSRAIEAWFFKHRQFLSHFPQEPSR